MGVSCNCQQSHSIIMSVCTICVSGYNIVELANACVIIYYTAYKTLEIPVSQDMQEMAI